MKLNNEHGFTLPEIIVVIAILAIMSTIALPIYVHYQYTSSIKTDFATSSEIIRAARTYTILNHGEIAELDNLIDTDYLIIPEGEDLIPLTSADSFSLDYDDSDKVYIVSFTTDTSLVGDIFGGKEYIVTENAPLPEIQR